MNKWNALLLFVFVIGAWLLSWFFINEFIAVPTDRGLFGDMFGAINSLFSGLAFAGVIVTIILQKQELSLQREELKMTREELKRTANAQEKSEEALSIQAKMMQINTRLATTNNLVSYYNARISSYGEMTTEEGVKDILCCREKLMGLIKDLESINDLSRTELIHEVTRR